MGLVSRGAALAAALVACAVVPGCGGSVADSDAPAGDREAAPSVSPFCAAAAARSAAIRPLNGLVARGGAPPEELSNTIDAVRRSGTDMLVVAPSEIRADVELTVQVVDLQLDALAASGGDLAAVNDNAELAERLRSPALLAASDRVSAHVTRNCGPGGAAAGDQPGR